MARLVINGQGQMVSGRRKSPDDARGTYWVVLLAYSMGEALWDDPKYLSPELTRDYETTPQNRTLKRFW